MSFTLLLAVTAAVAASMGYLAARKHGDDAAPRESDEQDDLTDRDQKDRDRKDRDERAEVAKKPAPKAVKKPAGSPFATLPLALGDVVQTGTEERWLAGAVVARDGGRVIGALFLAPEGAEHKAVAAFAPPNKDIWWMSPVALETPGEPPATIEIGGAALSRKGRLPVTLERLGQGAPPVGDEGIWAAYDRGTDVAIVLASQGKSYGFSGTKLSEHEYDRLGGGGES